METQLMRRPAVRLVAVSSFSAGALHGVTSASVLPPGLSKEWFSVLSEAAVAGDTTRTGMHLVTAFRLVSWQDKGLPEILKAVAELGRTDVRLTVCGTGEEPDGLRRLVRQYPCCTVRSKLSDRELAGELAAADLFVLATRFRSGRRPSGEGFGMVLIEAQLAGTPVVGPAHGGSRDAYLEGITGLTPTDESPEALAKVLDDLLQDPHKMSQMGKRAAAWTQESFDPEQYALRAVNCLL